MKKLVAKKKQKNKIKSNNQWRIVDDDNIRMIWACQVCHKEMAIKPTFYQNNGTPLSLCDERCDGYDTDMVYVRTEIKL